MTMSAEQTLREMFIESLERWAAHDVDALAKSPWGFLGYGYRARDARLPPPEGERVNALAAFFSSLEYYRFSDVDMHVLVDADTAIMWGCFTEHFKHKSLDPEVVRVRLSSTAVKRDGEWRVIWGHRDAQEFDADGRYLRRPVAPETIP